MISSLAQTFPSVSTVVIPSITTFQTISNIWTSGECRDFILDTRSLPSHAKLFESHVRLLHKSSYTKPFFSRVSYLSSNSELSKLFFTFSIKALKLSILRKIKQSLCSFGRYKLRPPLWREEKSCCLSTISPPRGLFYRRSALKELKEICHVRV